MSTASKELALNSHPNHDGVAVPKPKRKGKPQGYKHEISYNTKGAEGAAMKNLENAQGHLRQMRQWQSQNRKLIADQDRLIASLSDLDHRKPELVRLNMALKLHDALMSDHIADVALEMTEAERTLATNLANSRPAIDAPPRERTQGERERGQRDGHTDEQNGGEQDGQNGDDGHQTTRGGPS